MKAEPESAIPPALLKRAPPAWLAVSGHALLERAIPALTLAAAAAALGLGVACLVVVDDNLAAYPPAMLGVLCVLLQMLFLNALRSHRVLDWKVAFLSLLALGFVLALRGLPPFLTGQQVNGVLDWMLAAAAFLFVVAVPAMSASLYYLLGAKPHAEDIARYPLVLLPVVLAVGLYLILIQQMVARGALNFDLDILRAPFNYHTEPVKTFIAGDWPKWSGVIKQQAGMLNHVLGTGLLILLTTAISLPIGAGAGIYLSEYGDGRLAGAARFAINSLRAISVLILGLTAFSLAEYSTGTFLAPILHGTFFNGWEEQVVLHGGSYLAASLAVSLLVIPVITRATEEGCRSLPHELREGSLALGASEETTLRRVVVPWALPNIVTAVLLGSVETAGSVAVLLFIAGRGDHGVGPFRQVTSLAFLVFDAQFGDLVFSGMMRYYQFMAALILLALTLTLGLAALVTKRWLVRRFRGG